MGRKGIAATSMAIRAIGCMAIRKSKPRTNVVRQLSQSIGPGPAEPQIATPVVIGGAPMEILVVILALSSQIGAPTDALSQVHGQKAARLRHGI